MATTDSAPDLSALPLPQQLLHWAHTRPNDVALRQKHLGIWQPVTWARYAEVSRHFGLGLLSLGLKPGDALAILSENCQDDLSSAARDSRKATSSRPTSSSSSAPGPKC